MDVVSPKKVELRKKNVAWKRSGLGERTYCDTRRCSVCAEVVRAVTYSQPFCYVLTRAILYFSLSPNVKGAGK